MPFTISHVAAVLPMRSGRTRVAGLPTAPLVIGAMVPDLPAVLGAVNLRHVTHFGLWALPVDVVLAAVLWCGWVLAVRPVVAATLPQLAARWPPAPARRPVAAWWLLAAALGTGTHLVWDAFTHSSEGATWLGGMAAQEGVFLVLQLGSSVFGLVVLLVWARRWWRATSAADASPGAAAWSPVRAAVVVAAAVVVGGAWRFFHPVSVDGALAVSGPPVGDAVFGMLAGALGGVVLLTAAFWLQRWRSGASSSARDGVRESERASG